MHKNLVKELKEARVRSGLLQSEAIEAAKLPVKSNTLSNYETGVCEPDIDTFFKLCRLYDVDYVELLAKTYGLKRTTLEMSFADYEHMRKYQELDEHGKKVLDFLLQEEYERSVSEKLRTSSNASGV